jgi:hypothetical protein
MWPQGFLAPFLAPASSFFFSSSGFTQLLASLFPWQELVAKEIFWDVSNRGGGGVVFTAYYSAPSQLLISLLG